jgi:hypothetical protein
MEVFTKDQFKEIATWFVDKQVGNIEMDSGEDLTMEQVVERIRPLDSALASKLRAWDSLGMDILEYIMARTEGA